MRKSKLVCLMPKMGMRRGVANLLSSSGDMTSAAWTKSAVNVTQSSITPTTTSAIHRVLHSSVATISGVSYTAAIRASASGYRYVYINGAASPNVGQAVFDLQSGSILTSNGYASIASLGDGTFICAVGSLANAASAGLYIQINNSFTAGDATFAGDGVSSINVFASGLFQGVFSASQLLKFSGVNLSGF